MFLGVSVTVVGVQIPDLLRDAFAQRLEAIRLDRFEGNRRAAYGAAKVNSESWRKAEAGEPIREYVEVKIIKNLWPETGGDWRRLDPPLRPTAGPDTAAAVRSSNLPEEAKLLILAMLGEEAGEQIR